MKLDKQDILKALETISVPGEGGNMVESGAVKNVITFGDEVIVDITIKNPSLQAKKRTEVDIMKVIHDLVYEKAKVTVNLKVEAPAEPVNEIKGNPIPGIGFPLISLTGSAGASTFKFTVTLAFS